VHKLSERQQLEPLTGIQSVSLDAVVLMLSDHLRTLPRHDRRSRYGRVFIGAPSDVIGMDFEAVFVPGLAEGSFPRQIIEDPLLLDEARVQVSSLLRTFSEAPERELLLAAVSACGGRLFASWSQMELQSGRRRVPSLYPFELVRAAGRRYTEPRQLEIDARGRSDTRRMASTCFLQRRYRSRGVRSCHASTSQKPHHNQGRYGLPAKASRPSLSITQDPLSPVGAQGLEPSRWVQQVGASSHTRLIFTHNASFLGVRARRL
jgi:hypothetical protein